jgi:predicted peptidase
MRRPTSRRSPLHLRRAAALAALALGLAPALGGCGSAGAGGPEDPGSPVDPGGGASGGCTDNVAADPSLAAFQATGHIASAPGTLTLLPVGTAGAVQTRGYAEYVPPDYAARCGWPVIINLHGDGELGDGKTAAALEVFNGSCLPGMIRANTWDAAHRFVVLSPQFASYADRTGAAVNAFIQFAKANYKIDPRRIYLTAVSGGGVALGNYLVGYSGGEAAAATAVFCYVPPIAQAGKWKQVPMWLFDGSADGTVNPDNVLSVYTTLVKAGAPVQPRVTLFTGVGHDVTWVNRVYAPSTMVDQYETAWKGTALVPYSDVYDWLLQYRR